MEERVKKSEDEVRMVRYQLDMEKRRSSEQLDMEKRRSSERERLLEAEIARLNCELVKERQKITCSGAEISACNPPTQANPMAMHRLTNKHNIPFE